MQAEPEISITGIDHSTLWSDEATAKFLGVPRTTLCIWRHRGTGPSYEKPTYHEVKYRVVEIERWLRERPWARGPKKKAA